ncbi:type II secretion system protein [Alteromonas gilva]|uniref:Type II secretion system protein n=1 Tax=Alteromonas gilva TaxID=2987522 RepID=A0ABT5L7J5_9ALTE|nr:type II secretion system protein [Alteromonas gilva]MDC8833009.1 type II secretion system protein [Alteromonas gilva]
MRNRNGFTLIELLVVLVITSLTTALLLSGLSTTWQNFARLSSRNLVFNQAQLPKSWFIESVRGVLLSHPDTATFAGTSDKIDMVTFLHPASRPASPQQLSWELRGDNGTWSLGISEPTNQYSEVLTFTEAVHFEYLVERQWQDTFIPSNGKLPLAIRIQGNNATYILATVSRPLRADIPTELPVFGAYEF